MPRPGKQGNTAGSLAGGADVGHVRRHSCRRPTSNTCQPVGSDSQSFQVNLKTRSDPTHPVNNLNRYFTNQQLREFEMRVLFQMSPTDSGGLLDSPAASKLGRNRALFASEEQNRLEKFRPYGVPSEEWIRNVGDGLRSHSPG